MISTPPLFAGRFGHEYVQFGPVTSTGSPTFVTVPFEPIFWCNCTYILSGLKLSRLSSSFHVFLPEIDTTVGICLFVTSQTNFPLLFVHVGVPIV